MSTSGFALPILSVSEMSEQEVPVVYLSNMPYGTVASTIEYGLEQDGLDYV